MKNELTHTPLFRGMRHAILTGHRGSDVIPEMWERGLEHSGRLAEMHGEAFDAHQARAVEGC